MIELCRIEKTEATNDKVVRIQSEFFSGSSFFLCNRRSPKEGDYFQIGCKIPAIPLLRQLSRIFRMINLTFGVLQNMHIDRVVALCQFGVAIAVTDSSIAMRSIKGLRPDVIRTGV